jgi:hypothetical protein
VAIAAPAVALGALGDTTLLSRSGVFGPAVNDFVFEATLSADGRFVGFST